jgi:hypothetical protein
MKLVTATPVAAPAPKPRDLNRVPVDFSFTEAGRWLNVRIDYLPSTAILDDQAGLDDFSKKTGIKLRTHARAERLYVKVLTGLEGTSVAHSKKKSGSRSGKSVFPHLRQRLEMAVKCRGLTYAERNVLIMLTGECNMMRPSEAKVSVEYIAQIVLLSTKQVDRVLAELVGKKLIARELKGPTNVKRLTIMNWPLIKSDSFVCIPSK